MSQSSLVQLLKSSLPPWRRRGGGAGPRPPRGEAAARLPRPPVARRSNHLTRFGVVFIGLALMIGMAAVNNGHNLLYLVFSVMLATLLVSGAIAFSNLRGLELERHYPAEFHVDQTVPGALRIVNRKHLLASWSLRIVDYLLPEGGGRRDAIPVAGFCAIVRPGQAATIPIALHVPRRGVYRMVAMQAGTRYPYGLFQRTLRFDVAGQIVAYPRMLPRHLLAPMLGLGPGGQDSDRKGTGTSLFGVRNYQSGDPARLIHWKQSAKGQGMKLKEFEEERSQAFRLMLDLRASLPLTPEEHEHFERAVSATATLARMLLERDCSVALWTTWGRVPMGFGRLQLQRILRALARVAPQPWETPLPPLENEPFEPTTCLVIFQDPERRPGGAERIGRRAHRLRQIDVRRLAAAAAPTQTTETPANGR